VYEKAAFAKYGDGCVLGSSSFSGEPDFKSMAVNLKSYFSSAQDFDVDTMQILTGVRCRTKSRLPHVAPLEGYPNIIVNTAYYKSGLQLVWEGADLVTKYFCHA
jgi:glycine/D-amino acid oxidase-like deaminating enzyme